MRKSTQKISLSPKDKLSSIIENPEMLIKEVIKNLSINSNFTNLNNTFLWIDIAKKILKRHSDFSDKHILSLKYNLATVLCNKSDYINAKKLLNDIIRVCSVQKKVDKKLLTNSYYYLSIVLRRLGDFENAKANILYALDQSKNNGNYYCEYAEILFKLDKHEEAKSNYEIALEICLIKNGSSHPSSANILFAYGYFLASIGKKNIGMKKMNDAYSILENTVGNTNLYSVRVLGHIANFLCLEKKYDKAFRNMNIVFSCIGNLFGSNNIETITCKNNCARILIKLKNMAKL